VKSSCSITGDTHTQAKIISLKWPGLAQSHVSCVAVRSCNKRLKQSVAPMAVPIAMVMKSRNSTRCCSYSAPARFSYYLSDILKNISSGERTETEKKKERSVTLLAQPPGQRDFSPARGQFKLPGVSPAQLPAERRQAGTRGTGRDPSPSADGQRSGNAVEKPQIPSQ